MSIKLVIHAIPPGLNELLRMHWSQRRIELARWNRRVWEARCDVCPTEPITPARAEVHIERQSRGQLDPDNLHGAAKLVLDALVDQRLIPDDSPDHITLTVVQTRGPARTVIRITPLTAAFQA